MMRLLCCNHCKTIEEVPDYNGPIGVVDPLIEELVRQHNVRDPMAHGGAQLHHSPMRIANISEEDWARNRREVIKRVNEENKKVGFDAWVEESMNTYAEDALRCYKEHHRPQEGCIDYRDRSKIIGHPTREGRQYAKESYKIAERRDPALCDFCPVNTWVEMNKNWQKGLYKKS